MKRVVATNNAKELAGRYGVVIPDVTIGDDSSLQSTLQSLQAAGASDEIYLAAAERAHATTAVNRMSNTMEQRLHDELGPNGTNGSDYGNPSLPSEQIANRILAREQLLTATQSPEIIPTRNSSGLENRGVILAILATSILCGIPLTYLILNSR